MFDFVFIGLPKSGSSWFHNLCQSSSQIHVGIKDSQYFFLDAPSYSFSDDLINIDVNHDYIFDEASINKIIQHNRNVSVIIFLRSFKSLIISEYLHVSNRAEVNLSFKDYLRHYPYILERVKSFNQRLLKLKENISIEKIYIGFLEDLESYPIEFMQSICSFIGINPHDLNLNPSQIINPRMTARNKYLKSILIKLRGIKKFTLLRNIYDGAKRKTFINNIFFKQLSPITPEAIQEFMFELDEFVPELDALYEDVIQNIILGNIRNSREIINMKNSVT